MVSLFQQKFILGGRAHFNEHTISIGQSVEGSKEIAIGITGGKIETAFNKLEGKSNYYKFNCTKLIGETHQTTLKILMMKHGLNP